MEDQGYNCAKGYCRMADDAATQERAAVWETVQDITAPLRDQLDVGDILLDELVRVTVSRFQTLPRQALLAERDALLAGVDRLLAAARATGWPVSEGIDDLVASMEAMARWRNRDHLVAERDALAADNARLLADSQALTAIGQLLLDAGRKPMTDIVHIVQGVADVLAELADRVDGDGERVAERERLEAARDALAADVSEKAEALRRISTALTATGRDADSSGHGGPDDVAEAVEEALLDLSARWRGRDEALERVREAMGMAPSSPAEIADATIHTLSTFRAEHHDRMMASMLGNNPAEALVRKAERQARDLEQLRSDHWYLISEVWLAMHPGATAVPDMVDTAVLLASVRTAGRRGDPLPDAPADGGDCGGAA